MNRATNKLTPKNRHKKIIKLSKSFKGSLSTLFKPANQTALKALKYAYKGRKEKKRIYQNIWKKRINVICKINNLKYNILTGQINKKKILLNKKTIAKIFIMDQEMKNEIFKPVKLF